MRISKLYSNNDTFKNITFNLSGLNVIYADVVAPNKDADDALDAVLNS